MPFYQGGGPKPPPTEASARSLRPAAFESGLHARFHGDAEQERNHVDDRAVERCDQADPQPAAQQRKRNGIAGRLNEIENAVQSDHQRQKACEYGQQTDLLDPARGFPRREKHTDQTEGDDIHPVAASLQVEHRQRMFYPAFVFVGSIDPPFGSFGIEDGLFVFADFGRLAFHIRNAANDLLLGGVGGFDRFGGHRGGLDFDALLCGRGCRKQRRCGEEQQSDCEKSRRSIRVFHDANVF